MRNYDITLWNLFEAESTKNCTCAMCGEDIPAHMPHSTIALKGFQHLHNTCVESGKGIVKDQRKNNSGSASRCVNHTLLVCCGTDTNYDLASLDACMRFSDTVRVGVDKVKMTVKNAHSSTRFVKWALEYGFPILLTFENAEPIEIISVEQYKKLTDKPKR